MKAKDAALPIRHQKLIKASDFLLLVLQTEVRSAMRNNDPGLASAYAELAVLIQDTAAEARKDGAARLNTDQPEAASAAGAR